MCAPVLQALSTYQLSPEQVSDDSLDVLTGFQLVDGALRVFVVEGPAQGAGIQGLVAAVARYAADTGLGGVCTAVVCAVR